MLKSLKVLNTHDRLRWASRSLGYSSIKRDLEAVTMTIGDPSRFDKYLDNLGVPKTMTPAEYSIFESLRGTPSTPGRLPLT